MPTEISGSTGVNKIQDNTIVNADINSSAAIAGSKISGGVGKVLQVVSSIAQAYVGITSTSFVDTGTSATITPSSTSSKILCLYHSGICYADSNNTNFYAHYTLLRGSTNLGHSTGGISGTYLHSGTYNDYGFNVSFNYLDSPSTTSATTYKIQFRTTAGTLVSDLDGRSGITLMEIAG